MNAITADQFLNAPANIKEAAARGFIRTIAICTGQTMEKAAKVYGVVRKLHEQAVHRQVKVANTCLETLAKNATAPASAPQVSL